MKVEVKLFLGLEKHARGKPLKPKTHLEVRDGVTIAELVESLNLPEDLQKTILINGVMAGRSVHLHDNDSIAIFPPMAGG